MPTMTAGNTNKNVISISMLLLTQGFDATLNFFCTLFVSSLD